MEDTETHTDFDDVVAEHAVVRHMAGGEQHIVRADPRHVAFVQGRWIPEVAEFMEHDTSAL